MLRTRLLRTFYNISKQSKSHGQYLCNSTQRYFFCKESSPENSEKISEDCEHIVDPEPHRIVFTENELKKSPLERETYMKLLTSLDNDTQKRFEQDWENIQRTRTEVKNFKKQSNLLQVATDKNKNVIDKLKTMVEEERLESARVAKRFSLQVEKEKVFAISKFSTEILEVIDNIERLIKNCDHEKETDTFRGIEIVYKNSLGILKRFGVDQIPSPLGEQVNLDFHDIVFHVPYPGKTNGEILDVSQVGYTIGERVLRATKVGVVKNME